MLWLIFWSVGMFTNGIAGIYVQSLSKRPFPISKKWTVEQNIDNILLIAIPFLLAFVVLRSYIRVKRKLAKSQEGKDNAED